MDREHRRQVRIVTAFMALNVLANSLMDVCDMGTSTTTVQRGSGSLSAYSIIYSSMDTHSCHPRSSYVCTRTSGKKETPSLLVSAEGPRSLGD